MTEQTTETVTPAPSTPRQENAAARNLNLDMGWREKAAAVPAETAKPEEKAAVADKPAEVATETTEKPAETAPVEAKTAPEPKKEPEKAPERTRTPDGHVPWSRFNQVTEKLGASQAEIERLKRELETSKAKPAPDPVVDPEGHAHWLAEQTDNRVKQVEQALQQQLKAQQTEKERSDLQDRYRRDFWALASEDPTVKEAHSTVMMARKAAYMERGASEAQAEAQIVNDDLAFAQLAYRLNIHPGKYIQGMAVALGWKPTAPAPKEEVSAPAAPEAKKQDDAIARLEKAAEGKRSASKGSPAGGRVDTPLTIEDAIDKHKHDPKKLLAAFREFRKNKGR